MSEKKTFSSKKIAAESETYRAVLWVTAAVITCITAWFGWVTMTNHLGVVAYNFVLAVMCIVWVSAIVLMAVWALIRRMERIEERMLDGLEEIEIGRWVAAAAELGPQRTVSRIRPVN